MRKWLSWLDKWVFRFIWIWKKGKYLGDDVMRKEGLGSMIPSALKNLESIMLINFCWWCILPIIWICCVVVQCLICTSYQLTPLVEWLDDWFKLIDLFKCTFSYCWFSIWSSSGCWEHFRKQDRYPFSRQPTLSILYLPMHTISAIEYLVLVESSFNIRSTQVKLMYN